jgi:MSHA biogenesis protein MshE
MTGHLVLSTLHTNDAVSTTSRLLDMGAPSYLIAASLRGILAQRLVRKICDSCAEPHEPEPGALALVQAELGEQAAGATFRRGHGCTYCNSTGYQGRVGIYELLEMDDALLHALQRNDLVEFAQAAKRQPDYTSLKQSAMLLAARGITTMDQVMRVTFGMGD